MKIFLRKKMLGGRGNCDLICIELFSFNSIQQIYALMNDKTAHKLACLIT